MNHFSDTSDDLLFAFLLLMCSCAFEMFHVDTSFCCAHATTTKHCSSSRPPITATHHCWMQELAERLAVERERLAATEKAVFEVCSLFFPGWPMLLFFCFCDQNISSLLLSCGFCLSINLVASPSQREAAAKRFFFGQGWFRFQGGWFLASLPTVGGGGYPPAIPEKTW